MRSKINEKAWAILKEDEKLALSLKIGYNKSTWQAGEVMKRAHYKFLEIEARAKHFLKLFTEHFELYDVLIPKYIDLDERVKVYFEGVIGKRLTIREAVARVDDSKFKVRTFREEAIVVALEKLVNSEDAINRNFALMVFDFDRWNNYRILPLSIQEPSAYKRRNKNNDKRNIKNIMNINPYSLKKLIERYKYKVKEDNRLWMPIPTKKSDKKLIVPIKNSEETIAELSKIGFFIFPRKERAKEFYELLLTYDFYNPKDCKEGQKFWPKFREVVKNSINYNQIGKRIASRKFLESALRDFDAQYLRPKNTDPNTPAKKRKKNKGLGLE